MYCVQIRIICGVCKKSYNANIYPNHLDTQGHDNNVLKDPCIN